MNSRSYVACFSQGLRRLPGLENFLGFPAIRPTTISGLIEAEAVIVWGSKFNLPNRLGRLAATRWARPLWRVEDGFLRSLDLGRRGAAPLSLVVDKSGIYYDAGSPSDLENILNNTGWESPELLRTAAAARTAIINADLSKYNYSPPAPPELLGDGSSRRILVLDQTRGDQSIRLGEAGPEEFRTMLATALIDHPQADIFIKTHPEVAAGRRQGHFQPGETGRAMVIGSDYSPLSLLAQADEVYTVTSQMGFEALMLDKPVHCFGLPFYAGWGLTNDHRSCPRRRTQRTFLELFAAAYLLYPRYFNPISGQSTDIFEIIRLLSRQRDRALANRGVWAATCFSLWKHHQARAYLGTPGAKIRFFSKYPAARNFAARRGGRILAWSSKLEDAHHPGPDEPALIRMEDGFLRSVGLGSDFQAPCSLVMDPEGIYYDPGRTSGLEKILHTYDFEAHPALLDRARRLGRAIVELNLTKYNRVGRADFNFQSPPDRRVILAPGQVEDDASVRLGSPKIKNNIELLRETRRLNPDAFIIYKPHPDVEAGRRRGAIRPEEASRWADLVLDGVDLGCLWPHLQEVHTMTSQVGFEALLRGLTVHTYGRPFYFGWGLTRDFLASSRKRRLSLEALIAGTLILYPVYYDWNSGLFCDPEDILGVLNRGEISGGRKKNMIRGLTGEFFRAIYKIFKRQGRP